MTDLADQRIVQVALGARSYEIAIVSNHFNSFAATLRRWMEQHAKSMQAGGTALIVTDRNVAEPYGAAVRSNLADAGWTCNQVAIAPGEQSKTLSIASGLYDELVKNKADRNTVVIAVGGGVVGDLAGFVAATYARGVPFVQVPTSLLAHVDSSVGGKVAVNHPQAKNLIGAFYQPIGVFIDTSVLGTLPDRDYRSGLAEVVKYGVILDEDFFVYLEANVDGLNDRTPDVLRHIIARSCELKADVVEKDEFEIAGIRAALNYGHTFAHAFEALCGYGELMHGEAVAIGMIHASRLAERRGLIDADVTRRQVDLCQALNVPTRLPANVVLETDDILDRMKLDKKTVGGQLRFVLPTRMGAVEVFKDVSESDVRLVIEDGQVRAN